MDMKQIIAERIACGAQACFEGCNLCCSDLMAMLETPPDKKLGDYALPCFRLAKTLRKAPPMIAAALAEKVAGEEIERVEVVGGYLNVFLARGGMAKGIVEAVLNKPGKWGSSSEGEG